jgi:hypothetical protein
LDASVSGLIGAVPNPAVVASGAAVGASLNIFSWLVGQGLDAERFSTLRRDVNRAAGPVATIAKALTFSLDAISNETHQVLYETGKQLTKGLGPNTKDYAARQLETRRVQASIRELESVTPSSVTTALVTAHNALRDAVNNPKQDLSNLISAVDQFADLAQALRGALTKTTTKTASSNTGS